MEAQIAGLERDLLWSNQRFNHHQMTLFFELDGPYKADFSSSKEEDKLSKERYVLTRFNDDELNGFEIKGHSEQLIKVLQSQILEKFSLGSTTKKMLRSSFCTSELQFTALT
ncbi:DNA polymerase epsilon catalytic subunit [Mycena venus]|uniref:DNA polymerase epsilon catalytic subunit n=1 Tax=Mycena venus TaxID=2733690 RepID=A0A8H6XFB8_9AGAR|nr:DNA polymerase epsilon catalytic subunit [Mycena venus]